MSLHAVHLRVIPALVKLSFMWKPHANLYGCNKLQQAMVNVQHFQMQQSTWNARFQAPSHWSIRTRTAFFLSLTRRCAQLFCFKRSYGSFPPRVPVTQAETPSNCDSQCSLNVHGFALQTAAWGIGANNGWLRLAIFQLAKGGGVFLSDRCSLGVWCQQVAFHHELNSFGLPKKQTPLSYAKLCKRNNHKDQKTFFPTCQVRVARFQHSSSPQPGALDCSGHCRTSTGSSRAHWALPDPNGVNVS